MSESLNPLSSLSSLNLTEMDTSFSDVLKNEYVSIFLIMAVSLYGGLIAPKLNYRVARLLDNQLFSLLSLLFIGYVATKNYGIAIVCMMSYLITMNTIQKHKMNDLLFSVIVIDNVDNEKKHIKRVVDTGLENKDELNKPDNIPNKLPNKENTNSGNSGSLPPSIPVSTKSVPVLENMADLTSLEKINQCNENTSNKKETSYNGSMIDSNQLDVEGFSPNNFFSNF